MSTTARKNGGDAAGRTPAGTFTKGNRGRPPGARNRATLAAEALLNGEAEALARKAVDTALAGDAVALRLCLERLVPPKRAGDRPLEAMDLPASPGEAMSAILAAVSRGELLLADAERLAGLYKIKADMAMLSEIEDRLTALEAAR